MTFSTKHIGLVLAFTAFLFSHNTYAQSYCIPPGFKDLGGVGEPFTYISRVELGNLVNTSGMPTGVGDDNGYTYFGKSPKPNLEQGKTYSLSITGNDNLGQGMVIAVWIDWDGDKEFDATAEKVASWSTYGAHDIDITVPESVGDGVVRMRVYCDMPIDQGHIAPEPCGYLNHPEEPVGQHGEVEDYDINIGAATGINTSQPSQNITVFPNPATTSLTVVQDLKANNYTIVNAFGQELQSGLLNQSQHTIDVSSLSKGVYFILVRTQSGVIRKTFQIV